MDDEKESRLGMALKQMFEEMERLGKKPNHDGSPYYYEEKHELMPKKGLVLDDDNEDEPMQLELFLN